MKYQTNAPMNGGLLAAGHPSLIDTLAKALIVSGLVCLAMLSWLIISGWWEEIEALYALVEKITVREVGDFWLLSAASLLGLRGAVLAWRIYLAAAYRPAAACSDGQLPLCTVIVPAYNEGRLVMDTLCSVAASRYPQNKIQIIAVDDGSVDDTWQWMRRASHQLLGRVELVRLEKNKGKRRALFEGFKRARGQVLVTIDSDSVIEAETLRNLASPFVRDRKVGAVAGNVRVLNVDQGIIPRMLEVSFTYAFDFIRAGQSRINTVICTPGALSAYRAEVLHKVLDQWMAQTFMGRAANIGEDRAMTNLILKHGLHVHYQSDAVVYTKVPTAYRQLCKMLLRWARSNVRETLVMSRFLFTRFRDTGKTGARVNLVLHLFTMTAGEVLKLAGLCYLATSVVAVGFDLLVGVAVAATVPAVIFFRRRRHSGGLWAYPYALFFIFGLSWISLYALFTARRSGWLTRDLPGQSAGDRAPAGGGNFRPPLAESAAAWSCSPPPHGLGPIRNKDAAGSTGPVDR